MAERHLIAVVLRKYQALPKAERISKIQSLARQSSKDRAFIQRVFPSLYLEAFPSSEGKKRKQSSRFDKPDENTVLKAKKKRSPEDCGPGCGPVATKIRACPE